MYRKFQLGRKVYALRNDDRAWMLLCVVGILLLLLPHTHTWSWWPVWPIKLGPLSEQLPLSIHCISYSQKYIAVLTRRKRWLAWSQSTLLQQLVCPQTVASKDSAKFFFCIFHFFIDHRGIAHPPIIRCQTWTVANTCYTPLGMVCLRAGREYRTVYTFLYCSFELWFRLIRGPKGPNGDGWWRSRFLRLLFSLQFHLSNEKTRSRRS